MTIYLYVAGGQATAKKFVAAIKSANMKMNKLIEHFNLYSDVRAEPSPSSVTFKDVTDPAGAMYLPATFCSRKRSFLRNYELHKRATEEEALVQKEFIEC